MSIEIIDYFQNRAGEKFRFVEQEAENAKGAIIGVHGYAEHLGRYDHIREFFVSRGFSFFMMENRGHGKSVGRKGHIDRFDEFLDDLDFFRKKIEPQIEGLPLFIVSHSNGSLISARYALERGEGIKGLVLSGIPIRTAVKVNPIKLKVGMFLAQVVPTLSLPTELDPNFICHDKAVVEEYIKDPLVHKVMSVGFAKEFLDAMENLLARAKDFSCPVLFLHGSDDMACDSASAKEFHDNISSDDKQFVMYQDLWHEVFNEPQKDEILDTAAKWIEERL